MKQEHLKKKQQDDWRGQGAEDQGMRGGLGGHEGRPRRARGAARPSESKASRELCSLLIEYLVSKQEVPGSGPTSLIQAHFYLLIDGKYRQQSVTL